MQEKEKKITPSFKDNMRDKLCKLFLHSFFTQPNFLKGQVIKHLEIPDENVVLEKKSEDENFVVFNLSLFDYNYLVTFKKRIEEPKEIEVPKIVLKPKKWYQRTPEQMVVVEKQPSSDKPLNHWLLVKIE